MLITKKSMLSGVEHTRDIDVTEQDLQHWKLSGDSIQRALPWLSAEDREFLMSGATPEEWDATFSEDDTDAD